MNKPPFSQQEPPFSQQVLYYIGFICFFVVALAVYLSGKSL